MPDRIPLRSRETTAMQFLFGLAQEAELACTTLKDRLEATGQAERLAQLSKDAAEIATEILSTVPLEKLGTLKANMACLQMEIRIKRVTGAETVGYTYVPTPELRMLCAEAADGKCGLCLGGVEEAQACKFRKVLQKVMMIDLPNGYGGCEYRRLEWSDDG